MKKWIILLLVVALLSGLILGGYSIVKHIEMERKASYFYGTWKCVVEDDATLIFQKGRFCTIEASSITSSGEYFVDNSYVYTPEAALLYSKYRNVECLSVPGYYNANGEALIFVRAEDYDRVAAKEIVITMDNWDTYFEIGEMRIIFPNTKNEDMAVYVPGVYLKGEYLERLKEPMGPFDLFFTVKRDVYHCYVENPLGENPVFYDISASKEGYETKERLGDWRYNPDIWHETEKVGICAIINSGFAVWDNYIYFETNAQVTDVQGSIWLYPPMEE